MLKRWYEKSLKPDYRFKDLLTIDWAEFKAKGIKLVFLDIDNTLAEHGSRQADDYAREAVSLIESFDLPICILSNALSDRITDYAKSLDVPYMAQANKPGTKKILQKIAELNLRPEQTLMVGDQIFTDIWAGKRAGCVTIMVEQRFANEAIQIRFKRKLERFLFKRYENR
ncbi:MAG TPA: YqeG family HAD IIIA-type phosphatase [Clostridiaceae bacterium]|nr:YqeG family HAD IIIA-type phosphatase [Clostridiaceae bacterium]